MPDNLLTWKTYNIFEKTLPRINPIHCKNFPKCYAWLSVTFLGFISFEKVAGNNGFGP